jgi:hypothetical protein
MLRKVRERDDKERIVMGLKKRYICLEENVLCIAYYGN